MVPSASSCNELDYDLDATLTMLTKQEREEVLAQHSEDYSSTNTNNLNNLESETNALAHTSKFIQNFAMPKSDNEVEEARKGCDLPIQLCFHNVLIHITNYEICKILYLNK